MSDIEPPKIEFPCADYPIRVMGTAGPEFQAFVLEVFNQHAPGFDQKAVQVRPSRNGNYESVMVKITAESTAHLEQIFSVLKTNPAVKMVL